MTHPAPPPERSWRARLPPSRRRGLPPSRRRGLPPGLPISVAVTAVLAAVLWGVGAALCGGGPVDDAYIFSRFAENLADGHGFRFNPGGEAVEGFSSPLLMLLVAALHTLGVPTLLAARLLGFGAVLTALVLVARPGRPPRVGGPHPIMVALLLAACPAVAYWSVSAMDAPLLLLATVALARALESPRVGAVRVGLLAGLTGWVRPEGVAVLVTWTVVSCFVWPPGAAPGPTPFRTRLLASARAAAGALLLVVPLFAARLALFGAWFPNTYYAKVVLTFGERLALAVDYLRQQALALPGFTLLALILFAVLTRPRGAPASRLLVGVGIFFLYVVYVGGDHFAWGRFLLPPLGLAGLALARIELPVPAWARRGLVPALVVLGFVGLDAEQLRQGRSEVVMARAWLGVGEHLRATEPPGTRLAVIAAGATPYASGFETFDMLGLVSPEVVRDGAVAHSANPGHQRYNTPALLAFAPHLIIYPTSGRDPTLRWTTPAEIDRQYCYALADAAENPEVQARYRYEARRLPDGTWLELLRRRSPEGERPETGRSGP